MSELLDRLLRPDCPNVGKNLPTAKYKVKRLSEALGEDVVFTLRALPYGRVKEIQAMTEDAETAIVLAGVTDPDLRAEGLQRKFGAPTPAEAVRALLLPGEIADLSRAVEKLSGYRTDTIEEIKNALPPAATES